MIYKTTTGSNIISRLDKNEKVVTIQYAQGKSEAGFIYDEYKSGRKVFKEFYINWDPSKSNDVPLECGVKASKDSWILFGHELAHMEDFWYGDGLTTIFEKWVDGENGGMISKAEIYAVHMENKMRAEAGVALRTHYASYTLTFNDGSGRSPKTLPSENTRTIRAGKSLFYKVTHTTIYMSYSEYSDGYSGIGTKTVIKGGYDYRRPSKSTTTYEDVMLITD
ncbi:MAG: type III secretion system effector protein [Crocinitomicaceae bacterium]|nr:type III secretion system effector protein [Crocinitomicaceae bacterium]